MGDDEHRNYSVSVVQTQRLVMTVQARDEVTARAAAEQLALDSHFETSSLKAEILAAWAQHESEEGPVVSDEPGYAWRRGWFWVARLDFRGVALVVEDLPSLSPRALERTFDSLIGQSETVFGVERRYGYAYRLDGETLWSDIHTHEREVRRAARKDVKVRTAQAKAAAAEALLTEAKQRMLEPGNAYSLFKSKGGRWSVKSVLGDTTNPGAVVLEADAWSVDIKTVRALLARREAEVFLSYSTSGDPLAIRLTDAVIRPF